MTSRPILTMTVAAALAVGQVTSAAADAGNIVGGIVGGIIGGAIVNGANNNRRTTTRRVYRPAVSSATRAANRETQTALNYFGYGAGTADGVLGRRSRAAISSYQAFMNMPVTGRLTQFERDILIGAYNRGVSGSYETLQLVSKDPMGTKALLVAQRDILTGNTTPRRTTGYAGLPMEVSQAVDEIADSSDPSAEQLLQRSGFIQLADLNGDGNNDYILDTSFSGSSFWCSAVQCKTIVFVSTASGYARNDLLAFDPTPASFNCIGSSCTVTSQPESAGGTVMASAEPEVSVIPEVAKPGVTTLAGLGTLPVLSVPETKSSLASYCSKVSLMTSANGGFTNAAQMTNPEQVMGEQFCLARAFAMDESERIVTGLQGVTQAQVDAQCAAYGPALKDYVASLSTKPRDGVMADVEAFVASSGMDPAQLAPTAKVCLGVGYRKDDMDIALGSALLMVALGHGPYSELMGHHLSQGYGASENDDLAMPWYDAAIAAVYGGAQPVFAPGQEKRTALIEAAVLMLNGDDRASTKPASSKGTSVLPTFSIKNRK